MFKRLMLLLFVFSLFVVPVSASLWGLLSPSTFQFIPFDVNGEDINVNNLNVEGDFNAKVGYFDTLFTRLQVNQIEVDLNVVNDGNFQGSLGVAGQSWFSDFVNLHDDPVLSLHAATKQYVDIAVSGIEFDFFLTDAASDVGGYFDMIDFENGEAESTLTSAALNAGLDQEIFNWVTVDGKPEFGTLLSSVYDGHFHFSKVGGASKTVTIYWQLIDRSPGGVETVLFTSETSAVITAVEMDIDLHGVLAENRNIDGNRLVAKVFANVVGGGATVQVESHQEGTTDSHISVRPPNTALDELYLTRSGSNWMTGDLNLGGNTLQNGDVNATGDSNFANLEANNAYIDNLTVTGDFNAVNMSISGMSFLGDDVFFDGNISGFDANFFNVAISGNSFLTNLFASLLQVDNITIDGATISSDTGVISFGDENVATTGRGAFSELIVDAAPLGTQEARFQVVSGASGDAMVLGSTVGISQALTYNHGGWGMYFGMNANSGDGWIQQGRTNTATAYNLALQPSGGNVIIGHSTFSDTARLEVRGNVGDDENFSLRLSAGDNRASQTGNIEFWWSGTPHAKIGASSSFEDGQLDFYTRTAAGDASLLSGMSILHNGNVTMRADLDVAGTATINGTTVTGSAGDFIEIGALKIGQNARVNANAGTNDNLVLNGKGTGAVYFNFDDGTGGLIFANGAGGTVGTLDSSGNLQVDGEGEFGTNLTINTVHMNSAGLKLYGHTGATDTGSRIVLYEDGDETPDGYIIMNDNAEVVFNDVPIFSTNQGNFAIDVDNGNVVSQGQGEFDKMALGSNDFVGLGSGDANVSTLHYDTLTPKSPIVFELEDGVILTKVQGGDWVECNPSKSDCPFEASEAENKMKRIYAEREAYALLETEINACESSNHSWDGECFEIVRTNTDYDTAVEDYQKPIIEDYNCTKLGLQLQEVSAICQRETEQTETSYRFKEGCGWNGVYYCEVQELRN